MSPENIADLWDAKNRIKAIHTSKFVGSTSSFYTTAKRWLWRRMIEACGALENELHSSELRPFPALGVQWLSKT